MKKALYACLGILVTTVLVNLAGPARADEKAVRTLNVKLNYTGSGTVDDKHLIQVFLWDSPEFMNGGAMPIRMKSASSKNATITFADFDKSPVYVSTVFDANGGYNEVTGPPPSGSSVGLYSKDPGMPEPIKLEPGKTTDIVLAFDDSAKMP